MDLQGGPGVSPRPWPCHSGCVLGIAVGGGDRRGLRRHRSGLGGVCVLVGVIINDPSFVCQFFHKDI